LDLEDKELERLAQVQNRLRTEIDDLRNRVRVLGFEKGKMEREVVEREYELRRFRDAVCKLKDFYFLMFESKVSELIRSFE
jgi:FKBP-type peptidyl-prolyl cis-trans isomerase (trigger factor)